MGTTGAGEHMGTNETGTAAASGIAGAGGGPDVGAKLIEEIRRVLARIDAHAAGAGQATDADATPATSPAPWPPPAPPPSTPSSPASASPPSNAT